MTIFNPNIGIKQNRYEIISKPCLKTCLINLVFNIWQKRRYNTVNIQYKLNQLKQLVKKKRKAKREKENM